MARKDKRIKSKSIYTIRNRHMKTSGGTVYENDHVTILRDDGIYNEGMTLFTDSNFKFKVRSGNNEKKRHSRGGWVAPNDTEDSVWTLSTISGDVKSDESKIVLKPNYVSLKDFAYYGSALELVKASVNDIVKRFPAGISYYNDKEIGRKVVVDNVTYYYVANGFDIDCWTSGYVDEETVDNPMRMLAAGYKYFLKPDGTELTSPPVSRFYGNCPDSIVGQTTLYRGCAFYIYKDENGDNKLVTKKPKTGPILIPKPEIVKQYWETLDDFEKVLLNRNSLPMYKAVFETPYQTENGYFYENIEYVWPTVNDDGFTPDVETALFDGYLEALINLAQYHDEMDSDNIWRMLTHESIKNLDWTYKSETNNIDSDNGDIDSSRIQAVARIYGRQYDDIKRFADNIKSTAKSSYDEKNNVPDYFLSDKIDNQGWVAQSVAPASSGIVSDVLFSASTNNTYTPSDTNIHFMRRLGLGSNYIQSLKGTRRGIEAILGMFGYKNVTPDKSGKITIGTKIAGTYEIDEYIAVATKFPSYEDAARLRLLGDSGGYSEDSDNVLEDYPVNIIGGEYLIPWYDKTATYRDDIYFQSKGGWGKKSSKEINLTITSATSINGTNNFSIYEETIPYMRYADSVEDMLAITNEQLFENMVCYVTDITDIDLSYSGSSTDYNLLNNSGYHMSHYFILKNVALSTNVGYVDNDYFSCYGWRNIFEEEYDGSRPMTDDGRRVVYLESLKANFDGNNPHCGKGQYDNGLQYLSYFNSLFASTFNAGYYDYLNNPEHKEDYQNYVDAMGIGFGVKSMINDNKKCHYFEDAPYAEIVNGDTGEEESERESIALDTVKDVDATNPDGWDISKLAVVNPEGGKKYEVESSYSILNVKNLRINFGTSGNKYFKKYIENVVLKYLEEMIPSTTILSYTFDGGNVQYSDGDKYDEFGEVDGFEADMVLTENNNYWVEKTDKLI